MVILPFLYLQCQRWAGYCLYHTLTSMIPSELSVLALQAEENEKFMKRAKRKLKDELRFEYKLSDFPTPMARGKYAKHLKESSNIVVLKPEVAAFFPNEDAVNSALLSLIKLTKATTNPTKHSNGRVKKRAA